MSLGLLILIIMAVMVITVLTYIVEFFLKMKNSDDSQTIKTQNEKRSLWQLFGYADDTPNTFRAVVGGTNERGGPIIRYICSIPGKTYDPTLRRIRPLNAGEDPYAAETDLQRWVRLTFGKRYFGPPLIRNLRPLTIDRVALSDTTFDKPKLIDQLTAISVKRYSLYHIILRPTYQSDIDSKEGTRFSVTSFAIIEVFDPEPAYTKYPDSFLQAISKIIGTYISNIMLGITFEEYKVKCMDFAATLQAAEAAKRAGLPLTGPAPIAPFDITGLNHLLEPMGVEIKQLTMSDPEVNLAVQTALDSKATAKYKAEVKKTEAEGEANAKRELARGNADARRTEAEAEKSARVTISEGEQKAIENIATGTTSKVTKYFEYYKSQGMTNEQALAAANEMVKTQLLADAVREHQGTLALGTPVSGIIDLGGKK